MLLSLAKGPISRGRGRLAFSSGRAKPPSQNPRVPVTLINTGESTTSWTATSGGTRAATAITHYTGRSITAMKMTATAANTTTILDYATGWATAVQSAYDAIVFDMYVDFQDHALVSADGGNGSFIVGDAGFANFFQWSIELTMGWNRIVLHPTNATSTTGTPTWASTVMATIRFRISARAGYTGTFYIANVAFTGQTFKRSPFCLVFDDAREGVYDNAYPLMKTRGLVGSVGVIGDQIGQAGYMTAAELRELEGAGWSMFNHSDTHGASPFLTAASQATIETEISDCRAAMLTNGLNDKKFYAAPYGEFTTNYFAALNAQGVKFNRLLIATTGYRTTAFADRLVQGACTPCVQQYHGISAATALVWVDAAIQTKSMLLFLMHDILAAGAASPPAVATSVFTTLVDGLNTRQNTNGTLDCMNLDQWCEIGGLKYATAGYP